MSVPDIWYSYECRNPSCRSSFLISGSNGCVLDIRLPPNIDQPNLSCPVCQEEMMFCGSWDADEAGYSSRGERPR